MSPVSAKRHLCLVKFFYFSHSLSHNNDNKKGLVKSFKPTDTHTEATTMKSPATVLLFFFFLFTDKHTKQWNISRDETAEVEHGVRFSGDTRLFSTHAVTFRKDMQEENTKHRYDTDYILFSTADSGFSARTLARAVCLDVNQTLSCFVANLQRLQCFEHA